LCRSLARLDPNDIDRALNAVVQRTPGRRRRQATVGVDGTGLAPGAASSYFIRRIEHFGQPKARLHSVVSVAKLWLGPLLRVGSSQFGALQTRASSLR